MLLIGNSRYATGTNTVILNGTECFDVAAQSIDLGSIQKILAACSVALLIKILLAA